MPVAPDSLLVDSGGEDDELGQFDDEFGDDEFGDMGEGGGGADTDELRFTVEITFPSLPLDPITSSRTVTVR